MFTLLALLSCGGDPADTGLDADLTCDPVQDAHCLLPFPSTFFLREDTTTETGWRLNLTEAALPVNVDDVTVDPTPWNEKDGFSTSSALFAMLPGVDTAGLAGLDRIGDSLLDGATTVILDAETGARVPHLAEVEAQADDLERQLTILRPAVPLEYNRRYVVGIRGLTNTSGAALEPTEGFKVLRDGLETDDGALEVQRERFESVVFPTLEADGWSRGEVILAWDFVTVSEQRSLGRSDWMLEDALARVGAAGPAYTIDEVIEGDCAGGATIGRTLYGTFQAPLYLEDWEPGGLLTRDEAGMPYYNGEATVPFTVRVGCSLIEDPRPGLLVQFGHGVLGDQGEVESGFLGDMADEHGWVLFAVDWTGMKDDDIVAITNALIADPGNIVTIPERTMQGFIEGVVAGRMMSGGMASDEALSVDGVSLVDPSSISFYGISQGAILGGGYAAMSPDVERAVLQVGGMAFASLVTRSGNFEPFFQILEVMYEDWADISLYIGLLQHTWDPGESAGWVHRLDGTEYLIHLAIGDESVPPMAGHLFSRAAGAALLDPPAREVWGLEVTPGPLTSSALVEFDYGIDDPIEAVPNDADVHGGPPGSSAAQAQIGRWFADGVIEATCDGACDPD